jgi:hypothetical protein
MADIHGVDYKKRFVSLPAKLTNVATQGGRMRVLYDTFTTSSTGSGDKLYMGRLPADCKVWDVAVGFSADLTNSTTVDVGWEAVLSSGSSDLDGWHDGVAASGAISYWKMGGASTGTGNKGISLTPTSLADECSVVVTFNAAPADSKVVSIYVTYSID